MFDGYYNNTKNYINSSALEITFGQIDDVKLLKVGWTEVEEKKRQIYSFI